MKKTRIKIYKSCFSVLLSTFIIASSGCKKEENNTKKDSDKSREITTNDYVRNSNSNSYVEYNYEGYLDDYFSTKENDLLKENNKIKKYNSAEEEKSKEHKYYENKIKENKEEININKEENKEVKEYINKDEESINGENYFILAKEEIKKLLSEENLELAKEKGKETIKKGVDFIFYDGEIKGITFDELTEESKKVVYENLIIIDGWITEIFPNYKEEIDTKYQIVSGFISEKYYAAKDKIKSYIKEENYEKLIEIKDDLKDTIQNQYEDSKTKVKEWYEKNF